MIAHLILDLIPDEGLPDVIETLGEEWKFYNCEESPALAQPMRRLKARVTRRYERPAYSFPAEE
jgi:hypothetical protein